VTINQIKSVIIITIITISHHRHHHRQLQTLSRRATNSKTREVFHGIQVTRVSFTTAR
jgi:hypothetical protein